MDTHTPSRSRSRILRQLGGWLIVLVIIVGGLLLLARTGSQAPYGTEGSTIPAVTETDWARGPETAPAVLVEYSDFQCPACAQYEPLLQQLRADLGDQLRLVYRHFPLDSIHRNARPTARASEAAGEQGAFWEYHDILFERQTQWQDLREPIDTFVAYAAELNLDTAQFQQDYERDEMADRVQEDVIGGFNANVNATPTFFLNGEKLPSPQSYEHFLSMIRNVLP